LKARAEAGGNENKETTGVKPYLSEVFLTIALIVFDLALSSFSVIIIPLQFNDSEDISLSIK
jgi:hypothetical protein